MIKLTDFDKHKLAGLVYSEAGDQFYRKALEEFNAALKIKEDGNVYSEMALLFCHLRDYKTAQEYSFKAIELGEEDYNTYKEITYGNLADVSQTYKVLEKGIQNKKSLACYEMGCLHLFNTLDPDMVNPYKAMEYFDLCYEYTDEKQKGIVAYLIYKQYKIINKQYPYLKTKNSYLYMKKAIEYSSRLAALPGDFVRLFNEANKIDEQDIISVLFNCYYQEEAKMLFAFLLLEEGYECVNRNVVEPNSVPYLLIKMAAKKGANQPALLMHLYLTNTLREKYVKLFPYFKDAEAYVPDRFQKGFKVFIRNVEMMLDDKKSN